MMRIVLFLALVACKQGEGERCQVTADCASPLICNQATNRCVNPNSQNPIDTPTVIDSPMQGDAKPADAGVD